MWRHSVKPSNSLLPLLHAYFHEWMAGQRSASRHTILSYRDTWRLFLRFVAERNHRDVAQLTLADLSDKQVLAFLDHLEKTCRRTITTRNCRLAALHSFFSFLADRDPLAAGQCAAILRIPNKRAPKRTGAYLEPEELEVLMDQPDRKTKLGERDHVLLALLYNSGARISEALQVRPNDIRLDPPTQVRLYGKGRKERICPLWPETAELVATFLKRNPAGPDEAIFRNRYGNPWALPVCAFDLNGTFRRPHKRFLGSARNVCRRILCGTRPQSTWLPRALTSPSSATGSAMSAWTRPIFTRKPTWRRNDRPSKKLMVRCGQGLRLPGSGTLICWHGSTPCEPVPYRQEHIALTVAAKTKL